MQISDNFSLQELTKSSTATRKGILNVPKAAELRRLVMLTKKVLQPTRDGLGKPMVVNSAYRCLELNRAIGSKDSSQHVRGEAADVEMIGVDNYDLACWIRDNLEFDQLILEFYEPGDPRSGWVHVSYSETNNRNQTLTINSKGITPGLVG